MLLQAPTRSAFLGRTSRNIPTFRSPNSLTCQYPGDRGTAGSSTSPGVGFDPGESVWVSDDDIASFQTVGYSKAQILEVFLSLSFKTLSNYVNHLAETPLDDAFAARAWTSVSEWLAS